MGLYEYFRRDRRADGEEFIAFADNAPEWLRDAVYAAHQDALPNDWVFEACRSICAQIDGERFADTDDNHDAIHGWADGEVEIYTAKLWRWAADMRMTSLWADAEERANDLLSGAEDTDKRFAVIQYCALESIAHTIVEAWRESLNEADDDDS